MNKNSLLIFLIFLIISACEKDDFCTQNPVTPKLVLRFYDTANRESLKEVKRFSIIAQGSADSVYVNQTADSIAIPLNSITAETVYTLKMNTIDGAMANNQIATFTIKYTTEEIYVSRSCGFKVIFNDLTFSSDTSWIQDFTPTTLTTIDHQNAAHVQIFH